MVIVVVVVVVIMLAAGWRLFAQPKCHQMHRTEDEATLHIHSYRCRPSRTQVLFVTPHGVAYPVPYEKVNTLSGSWTEIVTQLRGSQTDGAVGHSSSM